jgi:hypothetical protein
MRALSLRAGPDAIRLLQQRGLRAEDVDIIPGASGGPKWLAIAGLDRFLFGTFLAEPRTRALHLIGSSIGSWRMAALAQRDPLAALERGHHAYIHGQTYSARPDTAEVTRVLNAVLDALLGATGVAESLSHPFAKLHIITAQGRALANSLSRRRIGTALAMAAALNVVSRRSLGLQFRRVVFSNAGVDSPLRELGDLPTTHIPLTAGNMRAALAASGSIPLVIDGVHIASAPGGVHWDGGVIDYHLDLPFGDGDGLILYPHFYAHVVPGWFDKGLRWRHARVANFRRALLLAPSAEFVACLPNGRIPDRSDFAAMTEAQRIRAWETVRTASIALGDELGDLLAGGRLMQHVTPWV